jgi:peptidoglycan hydrolase-like protein with peptidoglycan-binding domain
MRFGLDWAWGEMSTAALHGVGASFAIRYVSEEGNAKNITLQEATVLSHAGIDVVLVFETTAQRALDGRAAGSADADAARAQAASAGMPQGRPIYFAVDFEATPAQLYAIDEYFQGVADRLGLADVGAYGGYAVIEYLFDHGRIRWGWQTYAWSGGKWDRRAQLQQFSNGHRVGGVECDYNHALGQDFGQWRVAEPRVTENPHTPLVLDGVLGGETVAAMQWTMAITDDGVFDERTKRALQQRLGVLVDGQIGEETVRALQRHLGVAVDGKWGPETTRCLQEALNLRRF